MEKIDSLKNFDTSSYVSDIENYYKNLKDEIEVKFVFNRGIYQKFVQKKRILTISWQTYIVIVIEIKFTKR